MELVVSFDFRVRGNTGPLTVLFPVTAGTFCRWLSFDVFSRGEDLSRLNFLRKESIMIEHRVETTSSHKRGSLQAYLLSILTCISHKVDASWLS